MNHFIDALKNYAVFSGRATRANYWYYILFNIIFAVVISIISVSIDNELLSTIYSFGTFIPSIAVGVRRMHDVGKSGWFILIPIYNIILAATEGDHGPNEYGQDPYGNDDLNQLVEN